MYGSTTDKIDGECAATCIIYPPGYVIMHPDGTAGRNQWVNYWLNIPTHPLYLLLWPGWLIHPSIFPFVSPNPCAIFKKGLTYCA